jgi:hypothetical protein
MQEGTETRRRRPNSSLKRTTIMIMRTTSISMIQSMTTTTSRRMDSTSMTLSPDTAMTRTIRDTHYRTTTESSAISQEGEAEEGGIIKVN